MIHPRKDYMKIQDPEGKIPEDEPVFLLRGQDPIAAHIVRLWAGFYEKEGGDPRLIQMALDHADKMVAWPKKKPADLPDDYDNEKPAEPDVDDKKDAEDQVPAADFLKCQFCGRKFETSLILSTHIRKKHQN